MTREKAREAAEVMLAFAREEKLQQAAKSYASKMCAECINSEICKEMGLGCPRLRESIIAFSEGVK